MTESCESSLQPSTFATFLPAPAPEVVVRRWESAPKHLTKKRSLAAGAFLAIYLAAYIGVGLAAVAFVEFAWSAIFQ